MSGICFCEIRGIHLALPRISQGLAAGEWKCASGFVTQPLFCSCLFKDLSTAEIGKQHVGLLWIADQFGGNP